MNKLLHKFLESVCKRNLTLYTRLPTPQFWGTSIQLPSSKSPRIGGFRGRFSANSFANGALSTFTNSLFQWLITFCVVGLLLCPTAYGESLNPSRSSTPPDIQRILDRGQLVVSVLNQDNSPFFMERQGELTGLDVKIAGAIADQLGVSLVLNRTATTFDDSVNAVYRLEADLAISKISRTLKRAKLVRFSRPYVTMRQGLLVNRVQLAQQAAGRETADVIRNLKGKIGVIQGSSYVGFAKQKFPGATVVEFPSWSALVDAVVQGGVVAAYRDELEVKKIVWSQPESALQFQTVALTDTEDAIAVALPWDSQNLLAFVNQYLDTAKINHTADTLLQEFSTVLKPQP
jgi:polar amino acid transport system substrate-binding protein